MPAGCCRKSQAASDARAKGTSAHIATVCRVYALLTWLYPPAFRRAFGRELVVTFRSRFEDVLSDGGVREWIAFAAHIMWDTIRTSAALFTARAPQDSVSLLGLREGDAAHGQIAQSPAAIDLLFVAAGLVLGCGGWYAYFAILPSVRPLERPPHLILLTHPVPPVHWSDGSEPLSGSRGQAGAGR